MNLLEFEINYFTHYLLLENDFIKTFDYVTLSKDNYSTYSAMYLKLILSLGSEIGIMLQLLAGLYNDSKHYDGFLCSIDTI